jgi:hypothetical protein
MFFTRILAKRELFTTPLRCFYLPLTTLVLCSVTLPSNDPAIQASIGGKGGIDTPQKQRRTGEQQNRIEELSMNYKRITLTFATLIMIAAGAFAAQTGATAVSRELIDGYSTSYSVAPTEAVFEYLEAQGIDTTLLATDTERFNAALASLMRIEAADEETFSPAQELAYRVNRALNGTYDGTNVVYMELGNYRWILSPGSDE